jgi:N-acetylglucosaminyl-diphospho-decaprenol L-rhamnosyltransferase
MSGDVAAVVVTYNSADHIADLLDSLPAAFGGLSGSVVVVDNGSTDDTLTILDERTDCTVVRSTNVGYAGGMNAGVAASPSAEAVLILNPDAVLDAGSVETMLQVSRREGVGIVAPRTREADGTLSPTLRRAPTLARVGGLSFTGLPMFTERIEDPREYDTEHEVDWAVGAVLLIRSDCYSALGGMDDSFFMYSEETEFSLRARRHGWATVYTPDAGAMHIGGGSGESATTHIMKIVNRVRLYRRLTGPVRGGLYFWMTLLIEVRRGIFGHAKSWPTVRALLRPASRPAVLKAGGSLVPL